MSLTTETSDRFNLHIDAGIAARERGDLLRAIDEFRASIALKPQLVGPRCELAFTLQRHGSLDEAEAVYEEVIQTQGANPSALAGLGHIARQRGDRSSALAYFERAAAIVPASHHLKAEIGTILREQSRLEEAAVLFESVLHTDAQNWSALVGLALLWRQRGNHNKSVPFLQKAIHHNPDEIGLRCELAYSYKELFRFEEAVEVYRTALDKDPSNVSVLIGLSQLSLVLGDTQSAIQWLLKADGIQPKLDDIAIQLCSVYRASGDMYNAQKTIEPVTLRTPSNANAWCELGFTYRLQNDRKPALQAFLRAAESDFPRGMMEAAAEYQALGQPELVRKTIESVLQVVPNNLLALIRLAELNALGQDYEACIAVCDDLIQSHPQRVAPYLQKCRALLQLNRTAEAIAITAGLDEVIPNPAEADAARLEVFRTLESRPEAEALLEVTKERAKNDFRLCVEWILTQLSMGNFDEARAALNEAPAIHAHERSRIYYLQGMTADLQWRLSDAVEAFHAALKLNSHDPGAHFFLARIQFLLVEPEAAAFHLRQQIQQSASGIRLRGESVNISQNLTGQLLSELNLDKVLIEELRTAREKSSEESISLLCGIVNRQPHLTPPAIYLLLSLRQSGHFEALSRSDESEKKSKIPRHILQFWDRTSPPDEVMALMHSWRVFNPSYRYECFNNLSAREYLANYYSDDVVQAFRKSRHPAQASDLFRLAYLYREGGFYADADDRCTGPLSEITDSEAIFIAYQEPYATVGNNFLACVPGEEVIGRALDLAVLTLNRGDEDLIWLSTGPGLLTRAFAQLAAEHAETMKWWLNRRIILERTELGKICAPHAAASYKRSRKSWLRSAFKHKAARA